MVNNNSHLLDAGNLTEGVENRGSLRTELVMTLEIMFKILYKRRSIRHNLSKFGNE